MIYLIGGAPRVGKTTLAQMLLTRKGVPYMPADVLAHSANAFGETKVPIDNRDTWADVPDAFFTMLSAVVSSLKYHAPDYTIEGDSFFPKQVKQLMEKEEIRCCFLGASAITLEDIRKYAFDDWVGQKPEDEQQTLPAWIVEKSVMFKAECEKYGIPFFDLAVEREKTLEAAYNSLIA